jgi:hypothetical protein
MRACLNTNEVKKYTGRTLEQQITVALTQTLQLPRDSPNAFIKSLAKTLAAAAYEY